MKTFIFTILLLISFTTVSKLYSQSNNCSCDEAQFILKDSAPVNISYTYSSGSQRLIYRITNTSFNPFSIKYQTTVFNLEPGRSIDLRISNDGSSQLQVSQTSDMFSYGTYKLVGVTP